MNTVLGVGYTAPNPDTRSYADVATSNSVWHQLPYGQQFVSTFFSSPEITKIIQQNMVPPPVVPSYKSMFNPNNFYAVNGLLSSIGLPKSNVMGLPPSKGKK